MSILLISDVHLAARRPKITANFCNFLKLYTINIKALYILGDLFEIWLGDDYINKLHESIAIEVKKLIKRGIHCYFIHGNHDFLIGKNYADHCGMTLLPNNHVIEVYGYRLIILHGDTLCTNDTKYQNFRKVINYTWLQKLFLNLPLYIRIKLANKINNNVKNNLNKNINKILIDSKKVLSLLLDSKSTIMIHGHSHELSIHKIINFSKSYYRIALGAWYSNQISFIKINEHGINLIKILI